MTKALKSQLEELVSERVSVCNTNNRYFVMIISGILLKEKDGSYNIKNDDSYVSFRRCFYMVKDGNRKISNITIFI